MTKAEAIQFWNEELDKARAYDDETYVEAIELVLNKLESDDLTVENVEPEDMMNLRRSLRDKDKTIDWLVAEMVKTTYSNKEIRQLIKNKIGIWFRSTGVRTRIWWLLTILGIRGAILRALTKAQYITIDKLDNYEKKY